MVPGQIRTRQKDARQEVEEGAAEARGGRQGRCGHGLNRLLVGIPNGAAIKSLKPVLYCPYSSSHSQGFRDGSFRIFPLADGPIL